MDGDAGAAPQAAREEPAPGAPQAGAAAREPAEPAHPLDGAAAEPAGAAHAADGAPPEPSGDVPRPEAGAVLTALEQALAEARSRADDYLQSLQRLKADFDNYRRRVAQDQARWGEAAVAAFVLQLLPVVDNLERAADASGDAAEAVRQGVRLTLRQLHEVLTATGIEPMQTVGQPFDPERHEAVARGAVPGVADGTVAEEYRRGYLMKGTVLRPALVKVATAEGGAPSGGDRPQAERSGTDVQGGVGAAAGGAGSSGPHAGPSGAKEGER